MEPTEFNTAWKFVDRQLPKEKISLEFPDPVNSFCFVVDFGQKKIEISLDRFHLEEQKFTGQYN